MYRVVLNQLSRVLTMLFVYYSCNRVSLARLVPINRNHLLVQWNLYNPGLSQSDISLYTNECWIRQAPLYLDRVSMCSH